MLVAVAKVLVAEVAEELGEGRRVRGSAWGGGNGATRRRRQRGGRKGRGVATCTGVDPSPSPSPDPRPNLHGCRLESDEWDHDMERADVAVPG